MRLKGNEPSTSEIATHFSSLDISLVMERQMMGVMLDRLRDVLDAAEWFYKHRIGVKPCAMSDQHRAYKAVLDEARK